MFAVTSIFFLCDIFLKNGTKIYITDNGNNIDFDRNDYSMNHGMQIMKMKKDITVDSDELVLQFFLDDKIFKITDIQNNIFQNASITLFQIDKVNQKQIIFVGEVTKIEIFDHHFEMKIASQKQKLFSTICKLFSPTCRASLGDAQCQVDLNSKKVSGNVTAVAANQMSITSNALNQENGYFDYGHIIFDDDQNKKLVVRNFFKGGKIFFNSKPIFEINDRDLFEIFPGCDKKFITCKNKFNNSINFQGEPQL